MGVNLKKEIRRSVCLLLCTGMIGSGLPLGGILTSHAAQYTVQEGEIPTKASSIESLPTSVNCVAEGSSIQTPKNITWEINGNDSFYNAGSRVSVTGTITENGQKVEATVLAVPKQVVYLVDANVTAAANSAEYTAFLQNGDTALLKNQVPDQAYSSGTWGYAGSVGTDMSKKGAVSQLKNTRNETGYFALSGKRIVYRIPLEAGTYIAAGECAEWWGSYQRFVNMSVTYTDAAGQIRTDLLDTAVLGAQFSKSTAAGSFTLTSSQEVQLIFEKKTGTGQEAVLSGFTILKAEEELPPKDVIDVTVDGAKIDEANTFGGFGSVTCNNTSRLLMDYKSLHEDQYWKMMNLLFDKEEGAGLNHVKIEMGADVNSSSGTEPATMRSFDEVPNVKRGAGFSFAADAKSINPDITVEILRWGEPKWTQEGIGYKEFENPKYEARYQWYRKTIDAVYETYGYEITEVSPGQNERRKDYADDFAWIKYCAKRFEEDGENGVGAFDYGKIKIVAADLYRGMNTTVDYLMKDKEFQDLVDVISDHYQIWLGSASLTKLNQEYGKEIWYGESTAPMINASYRANVDPDRGGIGGSAGIAAMAERFIAAYAYKNADGFTSHMTELLFQPAIGAFYEGSAYSPKQLIGAFDPWSGYYEADGGIQMAKHFMEFADSDWNYLPGACYSDGSTGDGDITTDTSTDTRLAVKDPETDDYSIMFANNTSKERKYRISLKNMKTREKAYNVWETRGPDSQEAYDANWFQKITDQGMPLAGKDNTSGIELTVKPYSIVTVTSLTDRGSSYESGQNDSGTNRSVLELPYRDHFDYDDSFVEERGGTPLFTTDLEGAFEVKKSDDTGYVLTQMINGDNRPYNWNPWGSGSDESSQTTAVPWTVLGDHRWANYTAGIDVKLDTKGNGYGDNFAVLGVRELVHSSGAPYRAKLYESGKWELLNFNTVKKSGTIDHFSPSLWHKLQLKAEENTITMYVDGAETGSFVDLANPVMTGRVALMSGFYQTSFDNLEVLPIDGTAPYALSKLDDTSPELTWNGNVTHNICQGFAFYNRSYTAMPAGSRLTFETADGVGFDVFGKSSSARIKVTVDGQEETVNTISAGDRQTSYWNESLAEGNHEVTIEVVQGTWQVDGINLFTSACGDGAEIETETLSNLINYVKNQTFDSGQYPQTLLLLLEEKTKAAQEVLAHPASQMEADLAGMELRNALLKLVPSDTIVEVKNVPASLTAVQFSMPDLPDTVTVVNAAMEESEKPVAWDVSEGQFQTLWSTVSVTGTVEDTDLKVSTMVTVVPYGLSYFIDSGTAGVTDENGETGHSSLYDVISANTQLENDRSDQVYEEGSWGYVADSAVTVKGGSSVGYNTGIYESGLYVDYNTDRDIIYKLPMKAGSYRFMIGAQAYWGETHSGRIEIGYEDTDGVWQTKELGTATVSSSSDNIQFVKNVQIPKDGLVEVRIKKADTKIHLISWLAAAREVSADVPSVVVTKAGEVPELPVSGMVDGEEKEIIWNKVKESDFAKPWSTVKINGTIKDLGLPVAVTVEVIPDHLVYFIDSGVTDSQASSCYRSISQAEEGLLNQTPDQPYEEDSWGYTNPEDLGGPMGEDSDSRSQSGWWAKNGKDISYKLPLKAGTYQFYSGFYEWWSVTRPMEASVTYQDKEGKEVTVSLGRITISKPEESILKPLVNVEIPADQTVEFKVKKTGDSDPVISWLAVNEVVDEEPPEETVYETTKIRVTQKPVKKEYETGQELDQTGMEVTRYAVASPSSAVKEIILSEEEYQTEYDFSQPGRTDVTVSYYEWAKDGTEKIFTDSFPVTVREMVPENEYYTSKIEVTKKPRKLKYKLGEDLDTEGLVVTEYQKASPSNAVRKNILTEDDYDVEYDLSLPGTRNVKVVYYGQDKKGEERRFTDLFTVTVIRKVEDQEEEDDSYHQNYYKSKDSDYYDGSWQQDNNGWKLVGTDGSHPSNRWAKAGWNGLDSWYFFDEKGYIVTGWFRYGEHLYYLNPMDGTNKGCMLKGWQIIDGVWYYFKETADEKEGSLLTDTVTPDGYRVGPDGARVSS